MKVQKEKTDAITQDSLETDSIAKYRVFQNQYIKGFWHIMLAMIPLVGILYILHIHQYLRISIYVAQYIGLFLGLVLFAVFFSVPATKRSPIDRVPWYDWILAILGLFIGLYVLIFYPSIVMKIGSITTERFIISVVAILIILEAIRRVLGYVLLSIVSVFLAYGFFASYLPGIFKGSKIPINHLFNYLYLDPNSLISLLNIAATVALSFLLLGQILLHFNGADIFNNYALSIFGRFRGGPAKGAVVGSSLVGTISGGPVTNVMLTGTVTIPLMKKNGYTSIQAGAIESVASSGGQIMPPVMGVAAFMIADNLGIPYAEVALAAFVPAFLFYACLFFQVDLMAAHKGLSKLSKEQTPVLTDVLRTGWMILPIVIALVYFLFFKGYSPQTAGIYTSAIAVISLSFQKSIWKNIYQKFADILIDTGKVLVEIGVIIAAAGLIVGITGITGLGFNIGYILANLADYGLLFLLIICAIFSVILGMGMPSVAAYALVAVLVAPTIIKFGVDPIAAHLFVFYFSIVSNFTPPVALASFAAAPIAKASPHKIAFQAMKIGVVAYLVPFLFVYSPDLLLRPGAPYGWVDPLLTIGTVFIGSYLLSVAMEGFLFKEIGKHKRILVVAIAALLLFPIRTWEFGWLMNVIGFIFSIFFIVNEWLIRRKRGGV